MVYPYPTVRDEHQTMAACVAGHNLARFGDGELKLMHGGSAMREPANQRLGRELRDVLTRPNQRCLVGIPTLDPAGPKYENWRKHATRFCMLLEEDVTYHSAFVSRPDSAPWIETPWYAELCETLWKDRRAAVVCEPDGFMLRTITRSAAEVVHIPCHRHGAYAQITQLETGVMRANVEVAILAAGPAATCLANRLAEHGIHAIDLGSAGRFLYRQLWPEEYAERYAGTKEPTLRAPGA